MGRNNHNKIRNRSFRNRKFDLNGLRRYVEKAQQSDEAAVMLNAVLLFMPWAALFGSGTVISPVYAYSGGTDVSTDLDTIVFFAVGIAVLVLVIVFAVILKGKARKD
jgi:hypothetical protein